MHICVIERRRGIPSDEESVRVTRLSETQNGVTPLELSVPAVSGSGELNLNETMAASVTNKNESTPAISAVPSSAAHTRKTFEFTLNPVSSELEEDKSQTTEIKGGVSPERAIPGTSSSSYGRHGQHLMMVWFEPYR